MEKGAVYCHLSTLVGANGYPRVEKLYNTHNLYVTEAVPRQTDCSFNTALSIMMILFF